MLHIEKSAIMFSHATVVEIEKVYFYFLREKMLLLSCLRAQIGLYVCKSAHNFLKSNFLQKSKMHTSIFRLRFCYKLSFEKNNCSTN